MTILAVRNLTRAQIAARQRRLLEIREFWYHVMRAQLANIGAPGGGVSRIPTAVQYGAWRTVWLQHHDAFTREINEASSSYMGHPALHLVSQIRDAATIESFMHWLSSHQPDPTMHAAGYYVGHVDELLTRYEAALREAYREAPSRRATLRYVAEVATRLGRDTP